MQPHQTFQNFPAGSAPKQAAWNDMIPLIHGCLRSPCDLHNKQGPIYIRKTHTHSPNKNLGWSNPTKKSRRSGLEFIDLQVSASHRQNKLHDSMAIHTTVKDDSLHRSARNEGHWWLTLPHKTSKTPRFWTPPPSLASVCNMRCVSRPSTVPRRSRKVSLYLSPKAPSV